VLLPLLLVQAGIYTAWYYSRWAEEEQANLAEAWLTEATFDDFVGDVRRQEAAVGAALAGLSPHTAEQAKEFLLASAKAFPSIRLWYWIDPRGDVIASNQSNLTHLNVADRQYFQEVRGGKPWAISDVFTDRVTGTPTFVIARRVEGQKGALLGVLSATVTVVRLGEETMPKHRANEGTVAIFDRQGSVVYCSTGAFRTLQGRSRPFPPKAVIGPTFTSGRRYAIVDLGLSGPLAGLLPSQRTGRP